MINLLLKQQVSFLFSVFIFTDFVLALPPTLLGNWVVDCQAIDHSLPHNERPFIAFERVLTIEDHQAEDSIYLYLNSKCEGQPELSSRTYFTQKMNSLWPTGIQVYLEDNNRLLLITANGDPITYRRGLPSPENFLGRLINPYPLL